MPFLHLALRSATSRHLAASSFSRLYQSRIPQRAAFSAASSLDKTQIETRVLEVLKTFEKVSPEKLKPSASFTNDLGLDSLDAVEVVMAVEEEFSIEIPDVEADAIQTVQQGESWLCSFCSNVITCTSSSAIDYIAKTPEGTFKLNSDWLIE
ncbi:acyl carrier protein-like protein [Lactifluus subvellereus]|nr:acyl carrier protein-like protein [Lactifluus subvellereus]